MFFSLKFHSSYLSIIQPKKIGLGTIAKMETIAVDNPIEVALSLFSTHLKNNFVNFKNLSNFLMFESHLTPRRKFAVPSVPPMNLFIHKKTKKAINFGMQSIGQAPGDADPPAKVELIAEFMHWQFKKIFVPFSYVTSSPQPAWQLEMYVTLFSPQIGANWTKSQLQF